MKKFILSTLLLPAIASAQSVDFGDYSAKVQELTQSIVTTPMQNNISAEMKDTQLKGNILVDRNGKQLDTNIAQQLLGLDINKLKELYPAEDILTSKTLFDRSFEQDKNSEFILPYTPLKDWMGLAHPPIRQLDLEASVYNQRINIAPGEKVRSSLFQQELDKITKSELSIGNDLKLIRNKEIHTTKMQLLEKSQKFFWGAVFLIRCDQYTMPFFNKMLEKQKAGLDVRLIIDRMGSVVNGGQCYKKLKKMGLNIYRVNKSLKTIWRETKKFGKRKSTAFHPKFWMNETQSAIVDGVNLMNIHVETTDHNHMYKDTGVLATGPISTDLKNAYIDMWQRYIAKIDEQMMSIEASLLHELDEQRAKGLRGDNVYKNLLVKEGACRFTWQDPQIGDYSTSLAMIEMLRASESYIAMTPLEYFLEKDHKITSPYTQFLQALDHKVRNENVALDYIVNRHGTWTFGEEYNSEGKYIDHGKSKIGDMINKKYKAWLQNIGYAKVTSYIQELKKTNPKARGWFHYVFNHSKILMVDNAISAIGSHNMNDRSFLSDIESMLICVDTKLAKEINSMFTKDMMNSISIAKEQ
jgi:phosphatidylserine/phosphatidylglycerophosphate/cardiolipin synthase-like enzyme